MNKEKCTIVSDEIVKHGLFFQSILTRLALTVVFPWGYCSSSDNDWDYSYWRKYAIRHPWHIILNWKLFFHLEHFRKNECDGFCVRTIRWPIVRKRTFRTLFAKFSADHVIDTITSSGYEDSDNDCGGACVKEITIIKFKDGTKEKIVKFDSYHYTYQYVIENEFLNN